MIRFVAAVAVTLALAASPARASAELLLLDGQLLKGSSVEFKEGVYLLTMPTGGVVSVPVELVKEMHLLDERPPTGLRTGEPATLVGPPDLEPPAGPEDQLAAFGRPPATWAGSTADSEWRPTSAWRPGTGGVDFNPARWARETIDPNWTPRSAYTTSQDVTEFNPVHWYQAPIESTWWPRSGFGATTWFPTVLGHRE